MWSIRDGAVTHRRFRAVRTGGSSADDPDARNARTGRGLARTADGELKRVSLATGDTAERRSTATAGPQAKNTAAARGSGHQPLSRVGRRAPESKAQLDTS